jgi:hypothetical protein
MASALDSILDLVKRKVAERSGSQRGASGGILGQITDMLGQRARPKGTAQRNVRPASEDPYGDPADAKGAKNVRPASEDPYGDPADQK